MERYEGVLNVELSREQRDRHFSTNLLYRYRLLVYSPCPCSFVPCSLSLHAHHDQNNLQMRGPLSEPPSTSKRVPEGSFRRSLGHLLGRALIANYFDHDVPRQLTCIRLLRSPHSLVIHFDTLFFKLSRAPAPSTLYSSVQQTRPISQNAPLHTPPLSSPQPVSSLSPQMAETQGYVTFQTAPTLLPPQQPRTPFHFSFPQG